MLFVFGVISISWGLLDLYTGRSWFISMLGRAKFTAEDDGYVFYMVVWFKIISGVLLFEEYYQMN